MIAMAKTLASKSSKPLNYRTPSIRCCYNFKSQFSKHLQEGHTFSISMTSMPQKIIPTSSLNFVKETFRISSNNAKQCPILSQYRYSSNSSKDTTISTLLASCIETSNLPTFSIKMGFTSTEISDLLFQYVSFNSTSTTT